jgi:hypothetical protein
MIAAAAISPRKRRVFKLILVLLGLTIASVIGEGALRITGRRPWEPDIDKLAPVVKPFAPFAPHPALTYVLVPGSFTFTQSKVTWHARHVHPFHRATRPEGAAVQDGADGVWFFGDSNTYGHGVNDEETYTWLTQQKHPELDVQNFAIGGYSTLHSVIQLEEALASGTPPPKLAVLAYASYHDGRNTMLRGNRKSWLASTSRYPDFPRAWLEGGELKHGMFKVEYTPWPLQRHSALVNFLEEKYNKSQVLTSGSAEVSKAIILKLRDICKKNGMDFVLASISLDDRSKAMLAWATGQGIKSVDISVDQTIAENIVPGDGHPSAKANVHFAEVIETILPTRGAQRSSRP